MLKQFVLGLFGSSTSPYHLPRYCETVIIGAGASGLAFAASLARNASFEGSVCILEKEGRLGGRVYDVQLGDGDIEPVGLGAWRVDSGHARVLEILDRHNVSMYSWVKSDGPTEARGMVGSSALEVLKAKFPTIQPGHPVYDMYDRKHEPGEVNNIFARVLGLIASLLEGEKESGRRFLDVRSIAGRTWGYEALEFLRASLEGYRALFDVPFDLKGMLGDTDNGEIPNTGKRSRSVDTGDYHRPIGGMSSIIRALQNEIEGNENSNVKIYSSTTVSSIHPVPRIHSALPRKLVLALPPRAISRIDGELTKTLFQTIQKGTQSNPNFKAGCLYESAWWEGAFDGFGLRDDEILSSDSTCLGAVTPYKGRGAKGEAALHVAYSDGLCSVPGASHWAAAMTALIPEQIHADLKDQLQYIFSNITVPSAVECVYAYWEDGGNHLPSLGGLNKHDLEEWATSGDAAGRDENVWIIGEGIAAKKGWVEGALDTIHADLKDQLQYIFSNITVPSAVECVYAYWEDGGNHLPSLGGLNKHDLEEWATSGDAAGRDENVWIIGEGIAAKKGWVEGALDTVDGALISFLAQT
ncbi:hypothetical protein BT69DRAFT_1352223 [Atractiella rhizophila]|nr:hypothetical protein BT69DRAFT_1352223 [Atractiella rhizophila]